MYTEDTLTSSSTGGVSLQDVLKQGDYGVSFKSEADLWNVLFYMDYMDMYKHTHTLTHLMVVASAGMASCNDSPSCQSIWLFIHKFLLASPSFCPSLSEISQPVPVMCWTCKDC